MTLAANLQAQISNMQAGFNVYSQVVKHHSLMLDDQQKEVENLKQDNIKKGIIIVELVQANSRKDAKVDELQQATMKMTDTIVEHEAARLRMITAIEELEMRINETMHPALSGSQLSPPFLVQTDGLAYHLPNRLASPPRQRVPIRPEASVLGSRSAPPLPIPAQSAGITSSSDSRLRVGLQLTQPPRGSVQFKSSPICHEAPVLVSRTAPPLPIPAQFAGVTPGSGSRLRVGLRLTQPPRVSSQFESSPICHEAPALLPMTGPPLLTPTQSAATVPGSGSRLRVGLRLTQPSHVPSHVESTAPDQ